MTDVDTLVIRVATVSDADALARLRYSWRVNERGERGMNEPSFDAALADWIVKHESTHVPFLAERLGEPIGMAWLALVDRVPGPQNFIRQSAYIQSVYVIASERSCGIGSLLMKFVVEYGRTLGLDYLAVHPSERAFSLYRRLGFVETDRVLELRSLEMNISHRSFHT